MTGEAFTSSHQGIKGVLLHHLETWITNHILRKRATCTIVVPFQTSNFQTSNFELFTVKAQFISGCCFTEMEYTNKLAKLAQTTRTSITEEVS